MVSLTVTVSYFFFLAGFVLVKGGNVEEFVINGGPGKFSWQNCEKDVDYPMTFTEMSLTPDPIHPGSNVNVSFTVEVKQDVGKGTPVQVDLEAKFDTSGTTVDICDYVECHYKDFCAFIKQYQSKCPPVVKKLVPSCQCPLLKKEYKLSNVPVNIPSVGVRVDGALSVKINVAEGKTKIGCLQMKIYVG